MKHVRHNVVIMHHACRYVTYRAVLPINFLTFSNVTFSFIHSFIHFVGYIIFVRYKGTTLTSRHVNTLQYQYAIDINMIIIDTLNTLAKRLVKE